MANFKIPSVRFNITRDPKDKKRAYLFLIFHYNKKRLKYPAKAKVILSKWDSKKHRVKEDDVHDIKLNNRLTQLEKLTKEVFLENPEIEPKDFRNELDQRTGRKTKTPEIKKFTLFEFIELFIEERKNKPNAKRGTWKIFRTTRNHLHTFSKEKNKELDFKDINLEFRHEFESWLYAEPRKHSTNYAAKTMDILKQFLNEATRREYNSNLVFQKKGWSISKEKTQKITLSFDELQVLQNFDFSDKIRLERVRDLFLIGCYTGLRFSDFTRITPENIVTENGGEYIELFTQKTDTEVAVPLLPQLKSILKKYDNYSPPALSNQKMNDYLKEVCQMAGLNESVSIKKNKGGVKHTLIKPKYELITTHTARRSFATNFYELGFTAFELMQITGHSTEKQFMEYINISKKRNAKNMVARMSKLMNTSPLKAVR